LRWSEIHSSEAFGCLIAGAAAFPITVLELTQEQFAKLNSTSPHEQLATSILLPQLSSFFKHSESAITVDPGDVVIQSRLSDTTIDDDCNHQVEALNGHAKGNIKNSSFLTGGIKLTWQSVTVFMDAELDSVLDIGGDVRVRLGKHIFGHHCTQLARKTMGISIDSDGKTGLGINMMAANAHLEQMFFGHADMSSHVDSSAGVCFVLLVPGTQGMAPGT